jgi:hypothetical protein
MQFAGKHRSEVERWKCKRFHGQRLKYRVGNTRYKEVEFKDATIIMGW